MSLITGCAKIDNNDRVPIANLAVYHVSPDAPKVGFRLNTSIFNVDSVAYGTYGYYQNAAPGTRDLAVYQGTTKKINTQLTLTDGGIYSAYLAGSWAFPELVVLEDSLSNPASGKANIRFVNMSVGAPSLDLATNTGTAIVSGRAYKKNSNFIGINGDQSYNFTIREHGSTVDKVLLPSVVVQAGRIYTIVAKGFYTGTGAKGLSGDVLTNY